MRNKKEKEQSSRTVEKNPNPQGKGLIPLLDLLNASKLSLVVPHVEDDSLDRVIDDYLGSLFIISCKFQFKPVPGQTYYIYNHKNSLILSMIEPERGGEGVFESFIGRCHLRTDLSWKVEELKTKEFSFALQDLEHHDGDIEQILRSIIDKIRSSGGWELKENLGYYQNVMSYMLIKSLNLRCEHLKNSQHLLSERDRRMLIGKPDHS